jgi:hypothetical protein
MITNQKKKKRKIEKKRKEGEEVGFGMCFFVSQENIK